MTKPTTEELKDLLGKVTPDWKEDGMTGDDPRMCGNLLRVKTSKFQSIFVAAWLDDENDAAEARANATLIALAPTLAAEVVRLRKALEWIRDNGYGDNGRDCVSHARKALDATREK